MEESPFVPEIEFYQPSTDDTREAYQALLSLIEYQLGTRPQFIMCTAAHEILSVLKDSTVTDPIVQKVEIEKLLKPIDYSTFDQLVVIAANITDYRHGVQSPQQFYSTSSDDVDEPYDVLPQEDIYEPKSVETSKAYKLLLDVIQSHLGPQPLIDRRPIAHLILTILKDGSIYEKKMMIEGCMKNTISVDTFNFLVFIGGLITDFGELKSYEGSVVRIGSASVNGTRTPRDGEMDPRAEKSGDREDGHDSNVGQMADDRMVCDEVQGIDDEHKELVTGVKGIVLDEHKELVTGVKGIVLE